MQIKFACFAPDLWVDTSDDKCSHSVHVVGSIPELGRWDEEKSIPLTKSCAKADTWECEVDVKVDDPKDVQYKYLIKRNSVLVRWEIIPPPFRSPLTATDTQDTLGKLPLGHPKRGGGKSNWMDRKLVTPRSGSEFRFTIGTDKFHPSVSLREENMPKHIGLRLRWGKYGEALECFSNTGGNIQSRRVDFISGMEEQEKRDDEHRNKVISLTGSSYAVFKFNADFDLLVENNKYCENWLELDVLDLDLNEVVGVSHFSLRYVRGETQGSFRSSVFANFKTPEQEPIGDVYVDYLVVHPFVLTGLGLPTKSPRMDTCFRKYWTGIHNSNRETLDIGHRGLGRSYARVAEQAEIRENTLLSFSEAGKQGAEYVELDIMLTKDRIPVVFHDFDIGVKGEAKGFKSSTRLSKANLGEMATRDQQSLAVYIAQLTLEQLKALKTTGTDSEEFASHSQSIKSFHAGLDGMTDDHVKVGGKEELISVPTLKQLLIELPDWLGLNVEIKYPVDLAHEWLSKQPQYELNSYLDDILGVLFAHVGKRRIVFSCFHPNICVALMLKQPRFPVCFLCGEDPKVMRDYRCCSLQSSISFAEAEYLLGIVTNSDVLFLDKENKPTDDPEKMVGKECVAGTREKSLVIWTWGDKNTFPHYVELQKQWGVDAVICDSIHKLVKKEKNKSIFQDEFKKSIDKHISKMSLIKEGETTPLPDPVSRRGQDESQDEDDIGMSLSPPLKPSDGPDPGGVPPL